MSEVIRATPGIVVLVLRHNDQVLFTKRSKAEPHLSGWIPLSAGGHIENGETADEAMLREAKEELGIDIKITRFLGEVKHEESLLVFEGKSVGGELKPDSREIREIRWIPLKQVKKMFDNALTRKIINLLLIVCATVVGNNEVLLVKHSCSQKPDFGNWLLPAGHPEIDENLEEALKREMKEELNLEIEIVQEIIEHIDPYTGDLLVNFLCIPLASEIKISSELAEARWFNLGEIEKMRDIHSGLKQFLIRVLESDWRLT